MILLIDNYDSFVHNLARYLRELGQDTRVVRNDALTVDDVAHLSPGAIVISPGPCTPAEAGISVAVVRELSDRIPILGVCLGHQAIGAAFGGRIIRAPSPVHGRTSQIVHAGEDLFAGLPNPLTVNRYHSLIVDPLTVPSELRITSWTTDGVPMALEHRSRPVWGVQFHPESILTQSGHHLLANFLKLSGLSVAAVPAGDATAVPASGAEGWPPAGPLPITW